VAWVVAVLLHAALIALALLFARERMPQEEESPPGMSVVFENGGQPQAKAPPAPTPGPPAIAEMPPPAAPPPPPPPQTAQSQPEVNLNMPPVPFATLQSAPEAPPVIRMPPQPHPQPKPSPRQKYIVMNNMSYGNPGRPAPPVPHVQQGMNMSLPQSDAEAVNAPELTIKGDIGADWNAELSKWVNEHKYYPQAAEEQGQQGSVEIEFTVDRKGNVTGLHLLNGSGSAFLDQAWLGMFAQNRLPPFPPGTKSDHITVDATMHYELIP
jgi:protein TonB